MKVVRVSEATNQLSHYLEYVKKGGTIRIVEYDQPVADLVPIQGDDNENDEALLSRLEKCGLVRRGKEGPVPDELLRPGPVDKGAEVLEALIEERRGSR